MSAIQQLSCGWQEGFLKVLPAVQRHARMRFRRLEADRREEAIQETVAAACVNYQLAAAQGKLNVVRTGSLADFAVRHVRTGRHVGGGQDAARDVMSPACHHRYGVRVCGYFESQLPGDADGWKKAVVTDRKIPVPDLAAFRIDFGRWFQTQRRRDRLIISALIAGENPFAIADRFGISGSRVSQLRRRYEQDWLKFQGEIPTCRSNRPRAIPSATGPSDDPSNAHRRIPNGRICAAAPIAPTDF